MSKTAADLLVERLVECGVDTVFGLPGDGINGVMAALRKKQHHIRFVHVRHEESAAFMACGYAKFTGRIGVCLATSGPGAIHLLNGLYDAKLDQAPVLAITGMTYHDLIGTMYQQDVNLDYLFADVAVFNQRVMGPAHVVNMVDLAVRSALAMRGVAHITFPLDIQEAAANADTRPERNVPGHTSPRAFHAVTLPPRPAIDRAVAILKRKRRIVILAGSGARGAADLLEIAAERLAAPIVKPLLGKDVVPDDSPYVIGGVGMLGTRPSLDALQSCDALLMVGSSFPYMEYMPKPGHAVFVQIDDDPVRIGLRVPTDVALVGDARATLDALVPLLAPNPDRSFLEEAQSKARDWWKLMEDRGTRKDLPMKPQVIAWELGCLLNRDAIVSADAGTIAIWAAQEIRLRRGQRFSLSGNLASMANGLPYAIAAQISHPDRQCVAFVGDDGFEMLMAEFATCVQYKLPVKVVIVKNNVLGMVKWEQTAFLGNPEYGVEISPIDFVKFAEACGGRGIRIEDPYRCHDQLAEALAMEGPVIVEAVVDPFALPMPPKIKTSQALHLLESMTRGQPNGGQVAMNPFVDSNREPANPASASGVAARVTKVVSDLIDDESKGDGKRSVKPDAG
ncbi:MAG: thiamine pyrophosphate-binding protein [Candidatus Dormibacteraeota bacterium]|nr:thiamine pyrophosphate-binding protein [Candidatus Dormibacteraeota bacterium]